jgi:hypothetical protein
VVPTATKTRIAADVAEVRWLGSVLERAIDGVIVVLLAPLILTRIVFVLLIHNAQRDGLRYRLQEMTRFSC